MLIHLWASEVLVGGFWPVYSQTPTSILKHKSWTKCKQKDKTAFLCFSSNIRRYLKVSKSEFFWCSLKSICPKHLQIGPLVALVYKCKRQKITLSSFKEQVADKEVPLKDTNLTDVSHYGCNTFHKICSYKTWEEMSLDGFSTHLGRDVILSFLSDLHTSYLES